jgi:hypothetical protein
LVRPSRYGWSNCGDYSSYVWAFAKSVGIMFVLDYSGRETAWPRLMYLRANSVDVIIGYVGDNVWIKTRVGKQIRVNRWVLNWSPSLLPKYKLSCVAFVCHGTVGVIVRGLGRSGALLKICTPKKNKSKPVFCKFNITGAKAYIKRMLVSFLGLQWIYFNMLCVTFLLPVRLKLWLCTNYVDVQGPGRLPCLPRPKDGPGYGGNFPLKICLRLCEVSVLWRNRFQRYRITYCVVQE